MPAPNLQMFMSTSPTTEVGIVGSPIDFGTCNAGEVTNLAYDILLYNDKGGSVGSDDAYDLVVTLEQLTLSQTVVSTGAASQTVTCTVIPLNSARVFVDNVEWIQVAALAGYGSTSKVFTLDLTTGVVTFGDGINGAIPTLGDDIRVDAVPDVAEYGDEVNASQWVGIKSSGVIAAATSVSLELATKLTNFTVSVVRVPTLASVVGVWDNAGKTGTNYYTGGSFVAATGVITLGTELTALTPYVEYTYQVTDDAAAAYTLVGDGAELELSGRLPSQNAKRLQLQVTVPADASTNSGVSIKVQLRVAYSV